MTLGTDERTATAKQFGVADAQVERDYLISLLLAHLSSSYSESIVFFGGHCTCPHPPARRQTQRRHRPHRIDTSGSLGSSTHALAPPCRPTSLGSNGMGYQPHRGQRHRTSTPRHRRRHRQRQNPAPFPDRQDQMAYRGAPAAPALPRHPTRHTDSPDPRRLCRQQNGGMVRPRHTARPLGPMGPGRSRRRQP